MIHMPNKKATLLGWLFCLALQKELESPTFRLGGGRSIQLSYWSIYWNIVAENKNVVNRRIQHTFAEHSHIL